MKKIGIEYDGCETVKRSIKSALDSANKDKSYLENALSFVSGGNLASVLGCNSSTAISCAVTEVSTIINKIQEFSTDFNKFVEDCKQFDSDFSTDFIEDNKIVNSINGIAGILSSGKQGVLGDTVLSYKAIRSGVYIQQLANGKYRIVGSLENRKIVGLGNAKGSTYRPGSANFNNAGLDKFVLSKNDSTFSQYAKEVGSKFTSNATKNVGSCVKGIVTKPNKFLSNVYKFDNNKLGNVGKGIGYLGVGVGVYQGIEENMNNDASGSKIAADITADTVKGLGGMAVATACAEVGGAIGTAIPIPILGTVVGAALGFALGYAGSWLYGEVVDGVKINGKTITEHVSSGIETAINDVGDCISAGLSEAGSLLGSVF